MFFSLIRKISCFSLCILLLFSPLSSIILFYHDSNLPSYHSDPYTTNVVDSFLEKHGSSSYHNLGNLYDGAPHLDDSHKEWIYFLPDKKSYERFESTIVPDNVFLSFPNLLAVVTDEKVNSNITDTLSFSSAYSLGYRTYSLPDTSFEEQVSVYDTLSIFEPSETSIQNTLETSKQIDTTNLTGLHLLGLNGSGIRLGVIDTGIDERHKSFSGSNSGALSDSRIVATASFRNETYGFIQPEEDEDVMFDFNVNSVIDYHGHGTHVASVAAGNKLSLQGGGDVIGAAPATSLVIAAIDDVYSEIATTTDLAIIAAFDWMLNQSVSVINISYGGPEESFSFEPQEVVIDRVVRNNIVVVTSAGNGGPSLYTPSTPGIGPQIISVAAADDRSFAEVTIASFSSRGPTVNRFSKPDISAPGNAILGAGSQQIPSFRQPRGIPEVVAFSGTSIASPQIAGIVACFIQGLNNKSISYNPGALKAGLMSTAVEYENFTSVDTGSGLVDAYTAYFYLLDKKESDSNSLKLLYASHEDPFPRDPLQVIIYPGITQTSFPLVVSSHPTLLNYSITDLYEETHKEYISVELSKNSTDYGQNVRVQTKLPVSYSSEFFNFSITFMLNDSEESAKAFFQFNVSLDTETIVGVDAIHTNWIGDRVNLNSQYLNVYNWGNNNSIGFVEIVGDSITEDILENIDVLWIPDSNDYYYPFTDPDNYTVIPPIIPYAPFSEKELSLIENWVNNDGGSLLVAFNGESGYRKGTSISTVNTLLTRFGLEALDQAYSGNSSMPNPAVPSRDPSIAGHPLLKDVRIMTHFGGVFTLNSETDNSLTPYMYVGDNPVAVAYEKSGGRAVFVHTNFAFENSGFENEYGNGTYSSLISNDRFVKNIIDWLREEVRVNLRERNTQSNSAKIIEIDIYQQGKLVNINSEMLQLKGYYYPAVGDVQSGDLVLIESATGGTVVYSSVFYLLAPGLYKLELQLENIVKDTMLFANNFDYEIPSLNAFDGSSIFQGDMFDITFSEDLTELVTDVHLYIGSQEVKLFQLSPTIYSHTLSKMHKSLGPIYLTVIAETKFGIPLVNVKTVEHVTFPGYTISVNFANGDAKHLGDILTFTIVEDKDDKINNITFFIDDYPRDLAYDASTKTYSYKLQGFFDSLGKYLVTMVVNQNDGEQIERIYLLNILPHNNSTSAVPLLFIILGFLFVAVLVAVTLLYTKRKRKREREDNVSTEFNGTLDPID